MLPGEYRLRAEHCNQYGTLATEVTISLASYLGEGASTEHLHLILSKVFCVTLKSLKPF